VRNSMNIGITGAVYLHNKCELVKGFKHENNISSSQQAKYLSPVSTTLLTITVSIHQVITSYHTMIESDMIKEMAKNLP